MHDCRQTQENLIDLIFDELNSAPRSRVLAEVDACADCRAEYRSYTETLRACDQAVAVSLPRESYWAEYHDSLSRRLRTATVELAGAVPFWKQLLTTSVRVPAPLAATVALLLLASFVFSFFLLMRPAPEPMMLAAPDSSRQMTPPQIKFVEAPVVRGKTITQKIYVPRPNGDEARRQSPRENLARVNRQSANGAGALTPAQANLSGFKPADEVKLRIIKGSNANEQ